MLGVYLDFSNSKKLSHSQIKRQNVTTSTALELVMYVKFKPIIQLKTQLNIFRFNINQEKIFFYNLEG